MMTVWMADAAATAGAKGIIHAGTGNGSIANPTMEGLKDAVAKGVVVVRSARVPNGATTVSLPMGRRQASRVRHTESSESLSAPAALPLDEDSGSERKSRECSTNINLID